MSKLKITDPTLKEYISWCSENFNQNDAEEFSAWVNSDASNKVLRNQIEWEKWTSAVDAVKNKTAVAVSDLGDIAAEDDPVLNYFLVTDTFKKIRDNKVVLVVGRKGTGKTALVKYFTENVEFENSSRALSLDSYPWKLHAQRVDVNVQEVEAYLASWKYLIAVQFGMIVINHPAVDESTIEYKNIKGYLEENYGSTNPEVGDILYPSRYSLTKTTLEPQVLGNKIGGFTFDKSNPHAGQEVNAVTEVLLSSVISLAKACEIDNLSLHFDELDRGLTTFDMNRKHMLIGLISAALNISRSKWSKLINIKPIVYLRKDLWDELRFSDKGKLKYGRNTIPLEWTSDSLSQLVENRIKKQSQNQASLNTVMTGFGMRGKQQKWDHIINRTFMRPRDVIHFMNSALPVALERDTGFYNPKVIANIDIRDARSKYSGYLKQELDEEIGAHWDTWQDSLKAFQDIATITFSREDFIEKYNIRKSPENTVEAIEALSQLYKYSVIAYEKRSGYGGTSWCFNYLEPEVGWDNQASKFKVHDGLKEVINLREERNTAVIDKGEAVPAEVAAEVASEMSSEDLLD